jgi:hypothetical protein
MKNSVILLIVEWVLTYSTIEIVKIYVLNKSIEKKSLLNNVS